MLRLLKYMFQDYRLKVFGQLGLIAVDLDGVNEIAWVPNAMVLVQAALVNLLATASDLFQARKRLLIACLTLAFIGAAIAPGSQSVGRLIAAQTLIGFGNAIQVLAFTVPSEILPKKWRPSKSQMPYVQSGDSELSTQWHRLSFCVREPLRWLRHR